MDPHIKNIANFNIQVSFNIAPRQYTRFATSLRYVGLNIGFNVMEPVQNFLTISKANYGQNMNNLGLL